MANDTGTFNFFLGLFNAYWNLGGVVGTAYLDGSKRAANPPAASNDWYCASVSGVCPATMPWHFGVGKPSQASEACVGLFSWLKTGVASAACGSKYAAMCKLPL